MPRALASWISAISVISAVAAPDARAARIDRRAGPIEPWMRGAIEPPGHHPAASAQLRGMARPMTAAPKAGWVRLAAAVRFEPARRGTAVVTVSNTGTQHVKLARLQIVALRDGRRRWLHDAVGWYILPGSEREFAIDLAGDRCAAGDRIAVALIDEHDRVVTKQLGPCER